MPAVALLGRPVSVTHFVVTRGTQEMHDAWHCALTWTRAVPDSAPGIGHQSMHVRFICNMSIKGHSFRYFPQLDCFRSYLGINIFLYGPSWLRLSFIRSLEVEESPAQP